MPGYGHLLRSMRGSAGRRNPQINVFPKVLRDGVHQSGDPEMGE
ncbi:hypothetical protein SAMN05444000_105134 [Shimia gijangensis]|uniref:Uncharacterized protein n=1 Tax=Shimia gijangensis TaxID=1470563 RepID=A0A1M6GVB3_9RHOB|nr:hypothetical protein SAMN05444000_105134 [Shimia gijangensis]